jgi:tetraacyldisaccharide-1-P 4'-kinase
VDRIIAAACAAGAGTVVTTEKDAVRLEGHAFGGLGLAAVPLAVSIEPAEGFASWLLHAIDASGGAAASRP